MNRQRAPYWKLFLLAGLFLALLPGAALAWVCCSAQFSAGRLQAGGVKGAAPWRYNPAGAPAPFGGAAAPAGIVNATTSWNSDAGSELAFAQGANTANLCTTNNDNTNTIGWNAFGVNGPHAVTFLRQGPVVGGVTTIAEFDICFNSNTRWTVAPSVDLESVALHELGHAFGLNHPDAGLPAAVGANGQRPGVDYAHVVMAAFANNHVLPYIKRKPHCDDKSGASFLYPLLNPPLTEMRDYAGQNSGGCEFGDAPDPSAAIARYPSLQLGEDRNNNGAIDIGDSIYRDLVNVAGNVVDAGDTRLSQVGALAPGAVAAGNGDILTALFPFAANEVYFDANASGNYTAGEPVYRDVDASATVSAGDVRLLPPAGLGAGSTVKAADADVGNALVAFAANEKHDNRIPDSAARFDPGEDLDGNGALNPGNGGRHKDTRMEWLGPITAASGYPLPESDEMPPTYMPNNPVLPAPGPVAPWLGGVVPGQQPPTAGAAAVPASATFETESRQVNLDELDDGVSYRGLLTAGAPVLVDILVNTNGLAAGRYVPAAASQRLYLNGWSDWNGDGDWEDWAPPLAGGIVFIGPGGMPPCVKPAASDEYTVHWEGSPGVDQFASNNFCGGTAIGANARVLTFWITPPMGVTPNELYSRFRLDYGEDVGMNLRPSSDLSLLAGPGLALDPNNAAHRALLKGFEQGEALYGEVEDYLEQVCFYLDPYPPPPYPYPYLCPAAKPPLLH
jgi:hypothetical protein